MCQPLQLKVSKIESFALLLWNTTTFPYSKWQKAGWGLGMSLAREYSTISSSMKLHIWNNRYIYTKSTIQLSRVGLPYTCPMQITIIVGFHQLLPYWPIKDFIRNKCIWQWISITLVTKFLTLVWWLGSAPTASNFFTTLTCPFRDALMRAVWLYYMRNRKKDKR